MSRARKCAGNPGRTYCRVDFVFGSLVALGVVSVNAMVADAEPAEQQHWAYRPIVCPQVPRTGGDGWARNAVDSFVLRRLDAVRLVPSSPAGRETLIRRVTLDLIGLPPTPGEVTAFVNDTQPGAFERVVDRLLASPHYGERWARPWLDAAHYADSDGYEKDRARPWQLVSEHTRDEGRHQSTMCNSSARTAAKTSISMKRP